LFCFFGYTPKASEGEQISTKGVDRRRPAGAGEDAPELAFESWSSKALIRAKEASSKDCISLAAASLTPSLGWAKKNQGLRASKLAKLSTEEEGLVWDCLFCFDLIYRDTPDTPPKKKHNIIVIMYIYICYIYIL